MNLQSQIRHLLTSLAALGTYLAGIIMMSPAETQAINDGGAALIDPLTALVALIVGALVRALIGWVTQLLRSGER